MTIDIDELSPQAGAEQAPAPKAEDLETIAREVGWKPEAEWKGEPPEGGFLSPADFIRNQKSKRDSLAKEISKVRNETEKRIKRIEERSAKNQEKAVAKAVEEIHGEYNFLIRQAIRNGDDEREEALRAEMDEKVKEVKDASDEEPEQEDEQTEEKWIEQFQPSYPSLQKTFYNQGHAWILEDDADPDAMRVVLDFVDSGVPFAEALEKADRALRKAYPDQYEAEDEDDPPARNGRRVPVLAPGSRGGGGQVSWASRLSQTQRAIAQKCVSDGLFGSIEEWAQVRLAGEKQ